jgi:(E)-2-((N-methylformamido)methylene)succinate hydrolase
MPLASYDQGNIRYEEQGTGESMILIHGVGLDHTMWEKQVASLSEHYHVIVYDMIGHGGSEHPPGPYTLEAFVEQLEGLMNFLKIKASHIVGFSMGGMVAQAFAIKNETMVKTLTIMSSVANRTKEQREAILSRVEEVKSFGPISTVDAAIERWFSEEYMEEDKGTVKRIRGRLLTNLTASYLAAYTLFATADETLWPELRKITVPTLILTGEHDSGSNPEMAKAMHKEIAGSELLVVPRMKHMLPVEGAGIINQAICLFLKNKMIDVLTKKVDVKCPS